MHRRNDKTLNDLARMINPTCGPHVNKSIMRATIDARAAGIRSPRSWSYGLMKFLYFSRPS